MELNTNTPTHESLERRSLTNGAQLRVWNRVFHKGVSNFKGGKIVNIEKRRIEELKPAEYNPRKNLQPGDAEYDKE